MALNAPSELQPRQIRAAEMLAMGRRVDDTADEIGVNRKTLWRWKELSEFQAAVDGFQQEAHQRAVGIAVRHIANAMTQILAIAQSEETPAAVRLMACKAVIDYSSSHIQTKQLEARLTALEELLND